jgi:hypothetical protein
MPVILPNELSISVKETARQVPEFLAKSTA